MATFTDQELDHHALDWEMLRDGGIWLYRSPELLAKDLDWLRSRQYEVKDFSSGSWHSELSMHDELSSVLGFPAYYGRNLDALNECMSEDLAVPDVGGLALCMRQFDRFALRFTSAQAVLNTFAVASRVQMLRGRRLLVLLQSGDPWVSLTGLGGISTQWNRHEWLLSSRGL